MARDSLGRRLLAALADATHAFTPAHATEAHSSRRRRLLAALADATPAFQAGTSSDEYNPRPQNTSSGHTADTATELFQAVEASTLRTDAITQLVRHSTQIEIGSSPLVYGFAQSEISRISQLLKELSEGGEVSYDGEDRDWILTLTTQSQNTIDATSLSTVDAGGGGFSGGLWASGLGQRYLEFQRNAIRRGVIVRRIFILDRAGQANEPDFLRIYRQQQNLGIHTRVLDRSTIPHALKNMLFDSVVFDGVISYEVAPASSVQDTMRPTIVKTNLALQPERVKERIRRFETLWDFAQEFE